MRHFQFADLLEELAGVGLYRSPGDKKLEIITNAWYSEFEEVDVDLFEYAIKRYGRDDDYFPTLQKLKAAVASARKTYSANTGAGFNFGSEMMAQTIVWGIQLSDDIKNGRCKSEEHLKRTEEKVREAVEGLDNATPGLTKAQKNKMFRRIVESGVTYPKSRSNQPYAEYLSNLALKVQGGE